MSDPQRPEREAIEQAVNALRLRWLQQGDHYSAITYESAAEELKAILRDFGWQVSPLGELSTAALPPTPTPHPVTLIYKHMADRLMDPTYQPTDSELIEAMRAKGLDPVVIAAAYAWDTNETGEVLGLTAGDHNYEETGIKLPPAPTGGRE
jgi:hypothetical protein